MDFSAFKAITFDCYGTLIDWEAGISAALTPLIRRAGVGVDPDVLLAAYGEAERAAEAGPFRPYREVLADVGRRLSEQFGFARREGEEHILADSIRDWPAFAETPEALRQLKARFRLAVLSNIDDDLFEGSRSKLGVKLDAVITAQQVRSYKPGRGHFVEAQRRLELPAESILHVAESRFHDIEPAKALGFGTVWVNRHALHGGPSASGEGAAEPDLEVADLTTLARLATAAG